MAKLGEIHILFHEVSAPQLYESPALDALIASLLHKQSLGTPFEIRTNAKGMVEQDDDAHDTCTLTACLNPLHPGPCKGWKHNLFNTTPEAWHALEAKRVEKANAKRLAKIEALKAQGKPIPKKLLAPIEPKPTPHAGQTAKAAMGEAHAAGQAVSKAAGVKVKEPGKVTLGQAIKAPQAPAQKGPKGKKPTLASHGIAFVIAQEKVTPQYKLDKAATITPEQWKALPLADQKTILAELVKVKNEGFGPQKLKATELIDDLASHSVAEAQAKALDIQHKLATSNVLDEIGKKQVPYGHQDVKNLEAVAKLPHATDAQKKYAQSLLDKHNTAVLHEKAGQKLKDKGVAPPKFGPPVAGDMVEAQTPDGKIVVGKMVTHDSVKSPSGGIWDIKPATVVHADPADKPGVKKEPTKLGEVSALAKGYSDPQKSAVEAATGPDHGIAISRASVLDRASFNELDKVDQKKIVNRLANIAASFNASPTLRDHAAKLHAVITNPPEVEKTKKWDHEPTFGEIALAHSDAQKKLGAAQPAKASEPAKPQFTPTGEHLGTHGAQVVKDEQGKKYLSKPDAKYGDFTSYGEVGVSQLAKKVGLDTPEVSKTPGGTIQPMLEGAKPAFSGTFHPETLSSKDVLALQKHHVLDWLVGNHDAHPGNFLRDKNGNLVEIDRGQAFKHYHEDKLSPDYHPNAAYGERPPVYNTLLKAAGKGDVQLHDPSHGELHDFITKVQSVPDSELRATFRPYAERRAAAGQLKQWGNDPEKFLDAVVLRKKVLPLAIGEAYAPYLPEKHPEPSTEVHPLLGQQVTAEHAIGGVPVTGELVSYTHEKGMGGKTVTIAHVKDNKTKVPMVVKPETIKEVQAHPEPKAAKPAKHVQYAIDVATHKAPKSDWSKTHLVAYQELSKAEFDSLPDDVKPKVIAELEKAKIKLLDPKKIAATNDLLKTFKGESAPAAPKMPKIENVAEKPLHEAHPAGSPGIAQHELAGVVDAKAITEPKLSQVEKDKAMVSAHEAMDEAVGGAPESIMQQPIVSAKAQQHYNNLKAMHESGALVTKWSETLDAAKKATQDPKLNPAQLEAAQENLGYVKGKAFNAGMQYQKDVAAVASSKDALTQEVSAAKSKLPTELTEGDEQIIHKAYRKAWMDAAQDAILYGTKSNWYKKQAIKNHSSYTKLNDAYKVTGDLAAEYAVARARAEAAIAAHGEGKVGTSAVLGATNALSGVKKKFEDSLSYTQTLADTIRESAGVAKRKIPDVSAAAVKTKAAEAAYYLHGYNSSLSNDAKKNFLVAKLGEKFAVPHKDYLDKSAEKAAKNQATATKQAEVLTKSKEKAASYYEALAKAKEAAKEKQAPYLTHSGGKPDKSVADKFGFGFTEGTTVGPSAAQSGKAAYVADSGAHAKFIQDLGQSGIGTYGYGSGDTAMTAFKSTHDYKYGGSEKIPGTNTTYQSAGGALKEYTGETYTSINKLAGSHPPGADIPGTTGPASLIRRMDAAFKDAPEPTRDVILFRGFRNPQGVFDKHATGVWNKTNIAGLEWVQSSYSSTSSSEQTAQGFSSLGDNGIVMRMIVRKGSGVKGVSGYGGHHEHEHEVILQRALKYRILADYGVVDGYRRVDVEVTPYEAG